MPWADRPTQGLIVPSSERFILSLNLQTSPGEDDVTAGNGAVRGINADPREIREFHRRPVGGAGPGRVFRQSVARNGAQRVQGGAIDRRGNRAENGGGSGGERGGQE